MIMKSYEREWPFIFRAINIINSECWWLMDTVRMDLKQTSKDVTEVLFIFNLGGFTKPFGNYSHFS